MDSGLIDSRLAEEEDDAHDSQLLLATNFSASRSNPEMATEEKSMRDQLIEASVWLVILVLLWTINAIVFKKCTTVLINYSLFLTMIRVAVQLPFYFFVYWVRLRYLKIVSKDAFDVPLWKYFGMGGLDALAGYLQTFAAARLPGSIQSLLQQSSIPIVMIASLFLLKTRYRIIQWLGAGVILLGVFLVVYPTLTDPSRSALAWIGLYLLSCVPTAFSNMWKESTFKRVLVDIWHLQTMVCIGQLVLGVVASPLAAILPPTNTPANLPRNMLDAVKCVFGQDSYPNDHCSEAGLLLGIYLAVNFIFNMVMLVVLRTSSATVVSLASACRLPLSNIAFTWVWLMGSLAQVLSMWDWLGLGVILFGLFLYSLLPPILWKYFQSRSSSKLSP